MPPILCHKLPVVLDVLFEDSDAGRARADRLDWYVDSSSVESEES